MGLAHRMRLEALMKLIGMYTGLAMLVFLAELNAQSGGQIEAKAPEAGAAIVTVGCVNRARQNGSTSGGPGVPPATNPATAADLANSQELTGGLLLNGATAASATKDTRTRAAAGGTVRQAPVTYVLDGLRQELERHVGHQVEVTGTLRVVKEGPPATQSAISHIHVASIKMLAGSC